MTANLHAPEFVNYACQLCGWCCHQYDISFSRADFERLSKLDWGRLEPALAGKEWAAPLRDSGNPDPYRLRYAADGACVFLDGNKCRMHKHVGEFGKTLGCSAYPFTFAATPSGVYVGCRFSCKAMAYGLGEPLARRMDCLQKQLALCAEAGRVPRYGDEVAWDGRRTLPWADYLALEEALIRVFLRDDLPLARRLFLAHKFVDVLHQAKLDRVRGPKFREFIGILETGLLLEAETEPLPGGASGAFADAVPAVLFPVPAPAGRLVPRDELVRQARRAAADVLDRRAVHVRRGRAAAGRDARAGAAGEGRRAARAAARRRSRDRHLALPRREALRQAAFRQALLQLSAAAGAGVPAALGGRGDVVRARADAWRAAIRRRRWRMSSRRSATWTSATAIPPPPR